MLNAFSFFNPGMLKRRLSLIPLGRDTDLVKSSAYAGINTGPADFGGVQTVYYINFHNYSRIAQTGSLEQIQFYMESKPTELTSLVFTVWRKDGSTYDQVASEEIISLISGGAGIKTVTLATPMNVQVGDLTGLNWNGSTVVPFFLTSITATPSGYYTTSAPTTTDYDWTANAAPTGYIPIQCYIQAPHVVFIGDSHPSGYPTYFPPSDNLGTNGNLSISYPYKVATSLGLAFQNTSRGAETTAQILARINTDAIQKKPFFVVINGGGNDVEDGVAHATTMQNIEDTIQACKDAGIIVFWTLIPPLSMDTVNSQKCDALNADTIALCATMGVTIIDPRPIVGEFRVGGDAGNLWDVQAAYDSGDGVHLNDAGYTALAAHIEERIESKILIS